MTHRAARLHAGEANAAKGSEARSALQDARLLGGRLLQTQRDRPSGATFSSSTIPICRIYLADPVQCGLDHSAGFEEDASGEVGVHGP